MFKVSSSHSKKAEGRHEITRSGGSGGTVTTKTTVLNGSPAAAANGSAGGALAPYHSSAGMLTVSGGYQAGGGFSENSVYETHEHHERKVRRVKRSKGDREKDAERLVGKHQKLGIEDDEYDSLRGGRGKGDGSYLKESKNQYEYDDLQDLINRLRHGIGVTNEKLDAILYRIEEAESRVKNISPERAREIVDGIIRDLNALERPIDGFFVDIETLKAAKHPQYGEFYQQVFGLHQRRMAYLDRCNAEFNRLTDGTNNENRQNMERYLSIREKIFSNVEECIEWVEKRLEFLSQMQFVEDLNELEQIFEQHKYDHREIFDFRHQVDQCIARQSEITAEDSGAYCDLLTKLEKEYAQLRELSSGRMLDLDTLIAFIRSARLELLWIGEREHLELTRNWSDLNQLDMPMLSNYYKQLLHEIELREEQFTTVHNHGAALLNAGHPAVGVIETYLASMQNQWDWLLSLTQCYEVHLQDSSNLHLLLEDIKGCEQWMEKQTQLLNTMYARDDYSIEEGEKYLRELQEMNSVLDRFYEILMTLVERSRIISPMWQRGERISKPMHVTALCNYVEDKVNIRKGDECVLLDNSDMISWLIRTPEGVEDSVPSVVFRLPPPDDRVSGYLHRLRSELDRFRQLLMQKMRMIRFNLLMKLGREIRGWDLKKFLELDPDYRDGLIKAFDDDGNKLLSEFDPNDPLGLRLREEMRLVHEHLLKLMQNQQRGGDGEASKKFDERFTLLLPNLEEFWRILNQRVAQPVPKDIETWERLITEQKTFEDALQALENEILEVQELFKLIPEPTLMQRAKMEQLMTLWENLWELSKWYVERLKASEPVLNGINEASHYIVEYETVLGSSGQLSADLEKLRALHSELLAIQLTLQQKQPIIDDLKRNMVILRQHVTRTRLDIASHPDVDKMDDEVQMLIVRWENICANVADRLRQVEMAVQIMMKYRPSYKEEIAWLDRVEKMIKNLRDPTHLHPDEYRNQLELLISEYSNLQERTSSIEHINLEGGRFIREAKVYDTRLQQFLEILKEIHIGRQAVIHKHSTTSVSGAEQVQKELDDLNRRFAQLASIILERRNIVQVLMQNYEREKKVVKPPPRHPTPPPRIKTPPIRVRTPPRTPSPHKVDVINVGDGDNGEEGTEWFDNDYPEPLRPITSTHEDDFTIQIAEDTEVRTKFYELDATKHVQTGEILTFVEAVRQGLLDLHSGEFLDEGGRISLQEAIERKFVSHSLSDALNTNYGIRDPTTGQGLTLLEAVQRRIYDPESRQLRDPSTGELLEMQDATRLGFISMVSVPKLIKEGILKLPPMSLERAIEQRIIDLDTGLFVGRFSGETLPLRDALRHEYISISSIVPPQIAITLTECIESKFIDTTTGEFSDRNSNDKFTLRDAVSKANALLNLGVREIVNTAERKRVTIGEALLHSALNTKHGNFTDLSQRQSMPLQQAYELEFIQKPLTLYDIYAKDLIDSVGRFIDRGTKKRMTLLEAIAEGLIDPDIPHIVDRENKEVISVSEALESGYLTPTGYFIPPGSNQEVSIFDAAKKGWFTEAVKYSIFDVKGIRNTKTNQTLSFNEAVEAGVIQLPSGRFVNLITNDSYSLPDSAEKGRIVDPHLQSILSSPSGLKDAHGNSTSLFQAVIDGIVDPKKAKIVDKRYKYDNEMTAKSAYDNGMISLRGAMHMTAIFNIHPTVVTSGRPKRVGKKETRSTESGGAGQRKVKSTLAKALKSGDEGGLEDALSRDFTDVVDSTKGPTVKESISEQKTETSQVLAPKKIIGGQSQETFTTVKRSKTKETTATGGQGGAALYRAITGGKGSLEVPVGGHHLLQASKNGLIDLNTGTVRVPESGRILTFREAIDLGIIDCKSITVKNPKTGVVTPLSNAFEEGFIDEQGRIYDEHSRKTLSLQNAIELNVLQVLPESHHPKQSSMKMIQFESSHGPASVMSYTPVESSVVEESETAWTFDASTGKVTDRFTGESWTLDEALRRHKIPNESLRVRDLLSGKELSIAEAVNMGLLDPTTYHYYDKLKNRDFSPQEAARHGLIYLYGGGSDLPRNALQTHVHQQSKKVVSTKEATISGPGAFVDYSLQKVLDLGWYDKNSGKFTHPETKKDITLKEAIMKGLFNPYESVVIDQSTGAPMSLLDGIQSGIINDNTGKVIDKKSGKSYDLIQAGEMGLIRSGTVPKTLESVLQSGKLDLSSGKIQSHDSGSAIPLHTAISKQMIDASSITVRDPQTGQNIGYQQAVHDKIVNQTSGLLINKSTGEGISLLQALLTGCIHPTNKPDLIHQFKKQDMPLVSKSSQRLGTDQPVTGERKEVVDIGGKQVMVKVMKDERGIEKGEYLDPSTGMKFTIQLHGDPYVTRTKTTVKSTAQVQQVELNPVAELIGLNQVRDNRTGRIISLEEAERIGLAKIDRKGKQLTKTYGVFRSDIVHALNEGVVDPTRGEHISLQDAIASKLVDIKSLTYNNPVTAETVDFVQAANMGLMDVSLSDVLPKGVCNPVNGERISVNRAIELKIINPKTGEVANPFSNQKLTWLDIVKPVYSSLTMEGVYDPCKGYAVPVTSAIIDRLLDPKTEMYCNPITNEKLHLQEAAKLGLIDEATFRAISEKSITDWHNGAKYSLLKAVDMGLIDPHNRTIQVDKSRIIPIIKAVEEGLVPRDVGYRMKRIDKLTFAEALGKGLFDLKLNQFTDPDSGKRMDIQEAFVQGYIDTGSVNSMERTDEKNLTNIIDSDEFDINSGRMRDKKSGLYLTFRQAIDKGVIDGDSLLYHVDTGKTLTLKEAVDLGRIDSNGKYVDMNSGAKLNLKDSIRNGLLALIASPMLAGQAVADAVKQRESQKFKFRTDRAVSPSSIDRGGGGEKILEEYSSTYRITPVNIGEPTGSLHIKTDVSGSQDRLHSLITSDPQALTERHFDFLQHMISKGFDLDKKIIENPATGQTVSLKSAVETGLMNVLTGEIVHPNTGRHYSIPKAVHLKLMDPAAAKTIMETMNLSLEELHQIIQSLSPRSEFSSPSPAQYSSSVDSGTGATYIKEVSWRGHPSELRESGGDMSQYATTTASRSSFRDDNGFFSSPEPVGPHSPDKKVVRESEYHSSRHF